MCNKKYISWLNYHTDYLYSTIFVCYLMKLANILRCFFSKGHLSWIWPSILCILTICKTTESLKRLKVLPFSLVKESSRWYVYFRALFVSWTNFQWSVKWCYFRKLFVKAFFLYKLYFLSLQIVKDRNVLKILTWIDCLIIKKDPFI